MPPSAITKHTVSRIRLVSQSLLQPNWNWDCWTQSKLYRSQSGVCKLILRYSYDCMFMDAPNQFLTDTEGGFINVSSEVNTWVTKMLTKQSLHTATTTAAPSMKTPVIWLVSKHSKQPWSRRCLRPLLLSNVSEYTSSKIVVFFRNPAFVPWPIRFPRKFQASWLQCFVFCVTKM